MASTTTTVNPATFRLTEKSVRGVILWDLRVCQSCLDYHVAAVELRRGETRRVTPLSEAGAGPCGFCEADSVEVL